jgi:hypothetical protein
MKLGQLIRMGGLALALATGMGGCDDDDPGKPDGGTDARTDVAVDTRTDTVVPETGTEAPRMDTTPADAVDGGADTAPDVSSEVGGDTSVDAIDGSAG